LYSVSYQMTLVEIQNRKISNNGNGILILPVALHPN